MNYNSHLDSRKWNSSSFIWMVFIFVLLSCLLISACDAIPGVSGNGNNNGTNNGNYSPSNSCNGVNNCNTINGGNEGNSSQPVQSQGNGTSQEIIVPTGNSQQVFAGDCVDTWQLANIHAAYNLIFQKPSWVRVKTTSDGSVDGQATIYRNSGCYSS